MEHRMHGTTSWEVDDEQLHHMLLCKASFDYALILSSANVYHYGDTQQLTANFQTSIVSWPLDFQGEKTAQESSTYMRIYTVNPLL